MPRVRRHDLPDGYFHVTARGVDGQHLYLADEDRQEFVDLATAILPRCGVRRISLVLMDTHYHLIVYATTDQLSRAMQLLNGIYARRFNIRYGRRGHLFAERFRSWVVRSEEHMNAAIRYVLENPVAAGIRALAKDWPWSYVDLNQLRKHKLRGKAPPKTSRQLLGTSKRPPWLTETATSTESPRVKASTSAPASTGR